MSSLTSNTRVCWQAVVYNEDDQRIKEGTEWHTEQTAIDEGRELVRYYIDTCGAYFYARIECRIIPIYE